MTHSDRPTERTERAQEWLDQVGDLKQEENPDVLLFADGKMPTIVRYGKEYRMMSDGLIYARRVDVEDVVAALERRPEPEIVPLETQLDERMFRSDFEDLHPEAEPA